MGHTVNSTWIDAPDTATHDAPEKPYAYLARKDKAEIEVADVLILDTLEMTSRGGREYEAGYANGLGIGVVMVGPIRIVFHSVLRRYDSWDHLIKEVSQGWSR